MYKEFIVTNLSKILYLIAKLKKRIDIYILNLQYKFKIPAVGMLFSQLVNLKLNIFN